jgi:hypothetical protein
MDPQGILIPECQNSCKKCFLVWFQVTISANYNFKANHEKEKQELRKTDHPTLQATHTTHTWASFVGF